MRSHFFYYEECFKPFTLQLRGKEIPAYLVVVVVVGTYYRNCPTAPPKVILNNVKQINQKYDVFNIIYTYVLTYNIRWAVIKFKSF